MGLRWLGNLPQDPFRWIWHKLTRRLRPVLWFWQRGRRGYSDRDLWSIYSYLYGVLSSALADMADNHMGHPGTLTDKEWTAQLREMAATCGRLYAEDYEGDDWIEQEESDYVQFITWFSKWMRHLWD